MNAKVIYNHIQGINPSQSTVSSIGTFVTAQNIQVADMILSEVISALPAGTLAYNIATSLNVKRFSEKQIWVIAYELLKNEEYCKQVAIEEEELQRKIAYDKARKSAKRAAKSSQKKQLAELQEKSIAQYANVTSEQQVSHGKFGIGKVLTQDSDTITIFFENFGEKKLLKKYSLLKNI